MDRRMRPKEREPRESVDNAARRNRTQSAPTGRTQTKTPPRRVSGSLTVVVAVLVVWVLALSTAVVFVATSHPAVSHPTQAPSAGAAELSAAQASLRETAMTPTVHPSDRWGAGMVYDAKDGYVLLFGGFGSSGLLADTWTYSGGVWTQVFPMTSPSARQWMAMAYDAADGYVLLFGGVGGVSPPFTPVFHDTWTYSGGLWNQLSPSVHPPGVWEASMAYDAHDGYTVLFGGLNVSNSAETWMFLHGNWTQLTPTASPSARGLSAMAYDPHASAIVLFGGYNSVTDVAYRDTWTFSGGAWTSTTPTTSPPKLAGGVMAYSPQNHYLVLFGGYRDGKASGVSSQTWIYSGGTWSLLAYTTTHPSSRGYAQMAEASANGPVVLFGGSTGAGAQLGDTWEYSGGVWGRV
jgi:hypothetical protein